MAAAPQPDTLPGLLPGPMGPATRAIAITPSDGNLLPSVARLLWIGGAGDVTLLPRDSQAAVTLKNVPVGMLAVWTRQVFATGTTATNIVALA